MLDLWRVGALSALVMCVVASILHAERVELQPAIITEAFDVDFVYTWVNGLNMDQSESRTTEYNNQMKVNSFHIIFFMLLVIVSLQSR